MEAEVSETVKPLTLREKINNAIPVDRFIEKYNIKNPNVVETLHEFPVLSYLLGSVTRGADSPNWMVTDGSAMFGLTNPEDAMRWKGIFNHIMGSARHVYFLADRIAHATPQQKQKLIELGYSAKSINSIEPELLRDHKLVDHAGRRQMDEYNWHGIRDEAHPSGDSHQNTVDVLTKNGADPFFLGHMNEEAHGYLLSHEKNGRLKDIQFSILTYGDWTYTQEPVTVAKRFEGLRQRQRADSHVLDNLEQLGGTIESDLKKVFGDAIVQDMMTLKPYDWEIKIRNAYA